MSNTTSIDQRKAEDYPKNNEQPSSTSTLLKTFNDAVTLNHTFFTCFCEKCNNNGTKKLILVGSSLFSKMGRRLKDTDMPSLISFLERNPDVVSLNLAHNRISDIGFTDLIAHLIVHNNIYELNVENNDIIRNGINYMCEVGENLCIKNLKLKGNKFGSENSKSIALLLLKNPYIEYLDIAEVNQTISSLVYFTTVLRLDQNLYNNSLKVFDVSRPNPSNMSYFDSAHSANVIGCMLRFNTSLTELYLQKYHFYCHDIEAMVVNARYNTTLLLLDLSNNNIGDHGVNNLAKWLVNRPALQALVLSRNIITDHGARILSFNMPFSKLVFLDISYNKITDNGIVDILNTLKKSPIIRDLRLFGNCVGHITAKIVQRMLISKVLNQTNLDARPYKIDHTWYFARYSADRYRPRNPELCTKVSKICTSCKCIKEDEEEYSRPVRSNKEDEEERLNISISDVSIAPEVFDTHHTEDCTCCYCWICKGNNSDTPSKSENSSNKCSCCECKSEKDTGTSSSAISLKSNNDVDKVALILKSISTKTRQTILDWIGIDKYF